MSKTKESTYDMNALYQLDGKIPVMKAIPFGIQHVLAMFVANIAPIMIIAAACGFDKGTTAQIEDLPRYCAAPFPSHSSRKNPSVQVRRAEPWNRAQGRYRRLRQREVQCPASGSRFQHYPSAQCCLKHRMPMTFRR